MKDSVDSVALLFVCLVEAEHANHDGVPRHHEEVGHCIKAFAFVHTLHTLVPILNSVVMSFERKAGWSLLTILPSSLHPVE